MMKHLSVGLLGVLLLSLPTVSQAEKPNPKLDAVVDKIAAQEAKNMKTLQQYSPLIETYIQSYGHNADFRGTPDNDYYYLGKASFVSGIHDDDMLKGGKKEGVSEHWLRQLREFSVQHRRGVVPLGFAQMAILDSDGIDRQHYTYSFVRVDFLGEVRCLVFDVTPPHSGHGRFLGRIWVEDQHYNIVRFNGTFVRPESHTAYMHFDSWRINTSADRWVPAYIFAEEPNVNIDGHKVGLRSQTRLWNYSASESREAAFTDMSFDSEVKDETAHPGYSPLASERMFEREAENNVLDRLERSGLLAPESDIDTVLNTVVNNIIATNNLNIDPEVRCRVLLTAPIESFTVGHTIVLSRGLIDVLPDEGSLATVLARELSHIVLAHGIDTKFGFSDRFIFADDEALKRLSMMRSPAEEAEADKESMTLLAKSPYGDKLAGSGLFLQQLTQMKGALPNLVRGRMGDSLLPGNDPTLTGLMSQAPKLEPTSISQIAALPLGARLRVDPWSNHVSLAKTTGAQIMSAREKMPFQITPFYLYLTRTDKPTAALKPSGEDAK
jgi:hypothetical protein